MKLVGALGTVAVLAFVTPVAHAAQTVEWTVDPSAADGCDASRKCRTIQAAQLRAGDGDEIRIKPKAGGYDESVTFDQAGIQLVGVDLGEVRVAGGLTFTGAGSFRIARLAILPDPGDGSALRFTTAALGMAKTVEIWSSILSGSASGAAVAANAATGSVGEIDITGRHVTIADNAGAAATAFTEGTGAPDVAAEFRNSIVRGTVADGTTVTGCVPVQGQSDATVFAAPSTEDYHLRVGSPAIDQGGAAENGEIASDVEGEARPATGWDCGADEFVNASPTAPSLVAGPAATVLVGQEVGFAASGASDPDAGRGGSITKYRWTFGDGTTAETAANAIVRSWSTPGTYTATVRAVDNGNGLGTEAESPASNTVAVQVVAPTVRGVAPPAAPGSDTAAPFLAITMPRPGQRLKLGRLVPALRGRIADDTGVRRVELALRRLEGRRCRWYDGRRAFRLGPCSQPRFFRAAVDDFAWRYAFPRRVRPRPGRYELRVRAVDFLGNATAGFTAAARTLIPFRFTR